MCPAMQTAFLRRRDGRYPQLLKAVDSPPDLWMLGTMVPEDALAIAIVGTRRPTPYGAEVAERLAFDLADRGVTIVSGLARGVDTAAHRGALAAGGRTVAVLGCGLDRVYPPENRQLARTIQDHGAVVSQFAPGTPPLPHHFPWRNRTMAGLTLGVVVVEAPERSGALITARFAADIGREVLAVPGKITSEASRGPHGLIIEGAKLVRDWSDVVQELPNPWRAAVTQPRGGGKPGLPEASSEEGRVLTMLKADEPQHVEALLARAGGPPSRLGATLMALELAGLARQLEGQRWVAMPGTRGQA
jgi:DNA processing protein